MFLRQVTHFILPQSLKHDHTYLSTTIPSETEEDTEDCFLAQKKTDKHGYEFPAVQGGRRSVNSNNRTADQQKDMVHRSLKGDSSV